MAQRPGSWMVVRLLELEVAAKMVEHDERRERTVRTAVGGRSGRMARFGEKMVWTPIFDVNGSLRDGK
jgi:hypothetical protein